MSKSSKSSSIALSTPSGTNSSSSGPWRSSSSRATSSRAVGASCALAAPAPLRTCRRSRLASCRSVKRQRPVGERAVSPPVGPTVCSNVLGWCDGVLGVCTCLLCLVEERLHPLLELVQLLVIKHRAVYTTTVSWKKAHVLDPPVDHVVRLRADGDLHRAGGRCGAAGRP